MKDQQAGINDKLDEECFSLEEEINSLRLEVSVIVVAAMIKSRLIKSY